jgi:hypothetical protein
MSISLAQMWDMFMMDSDEEWWWLRDKLMNGLLRRLVGFRITAAGVDGDNVQPPSAPSS